MLHGNVIMLQYDINYVACVHKYILCMNTYVSYTSAILLHFRSQVSDSLPLTYIYPFCGVSFNY